eukprot:959473-Lingulodinium_polyedra.AAC.1
MLAGIWRRRRSAPVVLLSVLRAPRPRPAPRAPCVCESYAPRWSMRARAPAFGRSLSLRAPSL